MYSFCTLFDSKYIDKGLALYYSLEKSLSDFVLYIFAFDDLAYSILKDMNLKNAIIVSLMEFETDQLLKLKKERSRAEYCWTCTPVTIEHVLDKYHPDMCTYLDSDLYFFESPVLLLDEIANTQNSVIITEHRFHRNIKENIRKHGKYCVQFNTFRNDEQGRIVLSWWKERCIEWCYSRLEDNKMGDQKYLDNWVNDFRGVHELQHLGGGVAPWNLYQYELHSNNGKKIELIYKADKKIVPLVFYHFQNLRYLPFDKVNINAGRVDTKLKRAVYLPYLKEIERIRTMLFDQYQVSFEIKKHSTSNRLVAFLQRNIMQFKVRSISDVISLKEIKRDNG